MGAVSGTAGRLGEEEGAEVGGGKLNARCVFLCMSACASVRLRVTVCVADCVRMCVSLKGWMRAKGESNTMSEC